MSDATLRMLLLGEDRGASKTLDKVGQSADDSGHRFEGLGEKVKTFAAGTAATFGGLAIGKLFADSLDFRAGNAKMTAQLGLTKTESGTAGKVAGSLFANNYGDSMGEVQQAVGSVIQNIDGMRKASKATLEDVSMRALNTAKIFDQDLGGVTNAVSQMLRTGLAKNAKEAFDVITVGMQNGTNKADDLLDTINEYSTQFRKLGLDGKTAMGLLSQGLKGGARDADIVADALKEFTLRTTGDLVKMTKTKDGPVASLTALGQAFAAAGLDATSTSPKIRDAAFAMQEQIAKGGKGAKAGLQIMLDGLRSIDDPLQRSQAAVALFGTQAEDMGAALYKLDPSKAAAGLGKVAGSADRANKALNDTPTAKMQGFFRTIQGGAINAIGGTFIPAMEKHTTVTKVGAAAILALVAVVGIQAVASRTAAAAQGVATAATVAHTVATRVSTSTAGTWLGVMALESAAWARSAAGAALSTTSTLAAATASKVAAGAAKVWAAGQWLLNAALTANPIGIVVVAIAALVAGLIIAYKKSETFRKVVQFAMHAVAGYFTFLWNNAARPALLAIGKALGFVMSMWAKMLGALGHIPGFGWAKTAARWMQGAADTAWNLGDKIKKIPASKRAVVVADVYGKANVGALQRSINQLRGRTVNVKATTSVAAGNGMYLSGRAVGGPVRAGKTYLVGERGPERVTFAQSGRVSTAAETDRAAQPATSNSDDLGYVVVVVKGEDGKVIEKKLAKVKRQRGGPLEFEKKP